MARKGVYSAGGHLIVCRNEPNFSFDFTENIL
jgi:hypothetical protein